MREHDVTVDEYLVGTKQQLREIGFEKRRRYNLIIVSIRFRAFFFSIFFFLANKTQVPNFKVEWKKKHDLDFDQIRGSGSFSVWDAS